MATLEQIQTKVKKLQAQAEAIIAKRTQAVLSDIRALMEKHGLTAADIDAYGPARKRPGRPAGKTSATAVKGKRKARAKADSSAKAKLPAKYRNPKTGQTWSGWARPPSWIKDVKDRSKFLIDANDDGKLAKGSAALPVAKKASAKKTAAKKAARKTSAAKTVNASTAKAPAKKAAAKKAPGRKTATAKRALAKTPKAKRELNGSGSRASSEPALTAPLAS
jgi:DNA-binding protein H-NS